jgi:hypothetical protein
MVERVMTVVRQTAHGGEQNIWFGKFKLPAVTRLKSTNRASVKELNDLKIFVRVGNNFSKNESTS